MKQGTTTTFNFHFNIDLSLITSIDFFFHCERDNKTKREPLLTKTFPENGYKKDGVIYMPLTQEETAVLPNKFYIEPQLNFVDKSSTKAHTKSYNMEPTIYTHYLDGNQSSGEEENIDINFEVDEAIMIGFDFLLDLGADFNLGINQSDYVMTFDLLNLDGDVLQSKSIDLPLEEMIIDARYDADTKKLILTLKNGNITEIDISDLIDGLVSESVFNNALNNLGNINFDYPEHYVGPREEDGNNWYILNVSDNRKYTKGIPVKDNIIEDDYFVVTIEFDELHAPEYPIMGCGIGTKDNVIDSTINTTEVEWNDNSIVFIIDAYDLVEGVDYVFLPLQTILGPGAPLIDMFENPIVKFNGDKIRPIKKNINEHFALKEEIEKGKEDKGDYYEPEYSLKVKFKDEINNNFNGNVYAWIQDRINKNDYSGIHVGDYLDIINIPALQTSSKIMVAGINTYYNEYAYSGSSYDGTNRSINRKHHIDFILYGGHSSTKWNENNSTVGNSTSLRAKFPYLDSTIYNYLNTTIYNQLSNELKAVLVDKWINIQQKTSSYPNDSNFCNVGKVWCLTANEVQPGATNNPAYRMCGGIQYPLMQNAKYRLPYSSCLYCWLMDTVVGSTTSAMWTDAYCNGAPGQNGYSANFQAGCHIGFRIEAEEV